MLFEVILELFAKPGQSDALRRWLETNLPETQAFDGCVGVHALESEDVAGKIVLIGFWQSREKWERYFAWRERRGDFATLAPMLEREPAPACYHQIGEWNSSGRVVP